MLELGLSWTPCESTASINIMIQYDTICFMDSVSLPCKRSSCAFHSIFSRFSVVAFVCAYNIFIHLYLYNLYLIEHVYMIYDVFIRYLSSVRKTGHTLTKSLLPEEKFKNLCFLADKQRRHTTDMSRNTRMWPNDAVMHHSSCFFKSWSLMTWSQRFEYHVRFVFLWMVVSCGRFRKDYKQVKKYEQVHVQLACVSIATCRNPIFFRHGGRRWESTEDQWEWWKLGNQLQTPLERNGHVWDLSPVSACIHLCFWSSVIRYCQSKCRYFMCECKQIL